MDENRWDLINELNGLKESKRKCIDPTRLPDIEDKILQIQNKLKGVISYEDCVDVTKKDLSDNVLENTGKLPFDVFRETLKAYGFTDDDIYKEELISTPRRIIRRRWEREEELCYFENTEEIPTMQESGIMVDYDLLPKEKIRKLKKNSKLKQKHPDKTYSYELIHVNPFKYKNVLLKLGIDISNDDYWNNLKENMKKKRKKHSI